MKLVKMARPSWATRKNRRWKMVSRDYESPIPPRDRSNDHGNGFGTVLTYKVGHRIKSPNGVDTTSSITCGRGIHAYTSFKKALEQVQRWKRDEYVLYRLLVVYAPKWYGTSKSKQRASEIWVSHEHKNVIRPD